MSVVADQLSEKRVTVMGLGRFGGGVGVTRWLCLQGARVTVTDQANANTLADSIKQLEGLGVEYQLGGHDVALLKNTDLLVVNPAVDKSRNSFFAAALSRGIPWTSEMNLFFPRCRGRIIGITGSVGKSTTTAMIGDVLESAMRLLPATRRSRVWVGGNIGRSLLDALPEIGSNDLVVLELSSFQLEDLGHLQRSPSVAVLTALRPNHLDRHGTFENYVRAKANIFRYQNPAVDHAIVCAEDDVAVRTVVETLGGLSGVWQYGVDEACRPVVTRSVRSGETVRLTWDDLSLQIPGRHNVLNAAAAYAVGQALALPAETWDNALRSFPGLPHRLQYVATVDGVAYYNDSKSTTPEAAITALKAFDRPAVILLGGYDKQATFDAMAACVVQRARAAVCYGSTGKKIHASIKDRSGSEGTPEVVDADGFEQAVHLARQSARPGDVVLLSPACASWDMFTNYEERGDTFCRIIRQWGS